MKLKSHQLISDNYLTTLGKLGHLEEEGSILKKSMCTIQVSF